MLTDLSMPGIDGRQVSETLARYRPSVAVLCMSADPDAVPRIGPSDTPVRVMLKPFTADDLYHAVRDAISRSADLTAIAEDEIVRAHTRLSKFAKALEASRTVRVHTLDLVVAARELRQLRNSGSVARAYRARGARVENVKRGRADQAALPLSFEPTVGLICWRLSCAWSKMQPRSHVLLACHQPLSLGS